MQQRVVPWRVILALLTLVCLVEGVHAFTSVPIPPRLTATMPLQFSRLHVLRTSEFPQNHIPPFAVTVTDARTIKHLFATIEALPAYPVTPIFCPVDWGVSYHLAFQSTTWLVIPVDIDAGGCQGVSIGGIGDFPQKWAAVSPRFWQTFAETLGVPVSTLTVRPQPSGPSAPTSGP